MNYLSTNIKYLRTRAKLSQPKLGLALGKGHALVNTWENAGIIPQTGELKKLSDLFKVSIHWLVTKDLMQETYPMIKANYRLVNLKLEKYDTILGS